jgi:hypothetical protein
MPLAGRDLVASAGEPEPDRGSGRLLPTLVEESVPIGVPLEAYAVVGRGHQYDVSGRLLRLGDVVAEHEAGLGPRVDRIHRVDPHCDD